MLVMRRRLCTALLALMLAIAAAPTFAASSGGHVEAWGYNGFGQATPPVGVDDIVAVAAGSDHSMALRANGTVLVWGADFEGQTNVPQGLSNVVAISAGTHCVALKSDGTV